MPKFTRTMAAAAASALIVGVGATQAQAAPTPTLYAASTSSAVVLTAGPKLSTASGFRTETLGAIDGGGFCIDYAKAGNDGHTWLVGAIGGMKAGTVRTELQFLSNSYPNAIGSRTVEPALAATLKRIVSGPTGAFESDWDRSYVKQLDARQLHAVVVLSNQMLAQAKSAGTVTLKETSAIKAAPGGKGSATFSATVAGRAFPGQPVRFTLSGGKVTSLSAKTNSAGRATVNFTPTGPVKVTAVLTSADWRSTSYIMPSTSKRQRLVRPTHLTVKTSAVFAYDVKLSTTVTQDCGSVCNGHPPITFTAAATSSPVQWRALSSGKQVASLSLKPGAKGSRTFTGTDAQVYSLQYRVYVGGKWSTWRTSQTITAVCPAWPGVSIPVVCTCDGTRAIPVTFTIPTSARYYTLTTSTGGAVQNANAVGGASVKQTVKPAAGDRLVASFTAYSDAARTKIIGTHVLADITFNS